LHSCPPSGLTGPQAPAGPLLTTPRHAPPPKSSHLPRSLPARLSQLLRWVAQPLFPAFVSGAVDGSGPLNSSTQAPCVTRGFGNLQARSHARKPLIPLLRRSRRSTRSHGRWCLLQWQHPLCAVWRQPASSPPTCPVRTMPESHRRLSRILRFNKPFVDNQQSHTRAPLQLPPPCKQAPSHQLHSPCVTALELTPAGRMT
jgi:hypothetical protein